MTIDSFNSYPKVWNFGHPNTRPLVGMRVRVEEKVDGSQFSFGVFDGQLRCRSRRVEMNPLAPTDLFCIAATKAKELADHGLLRDGWTYRGEAFKSPRHNTLEYGRIPIGGVILFDIADSLNGYVPRSVVETEAERLGLECVPVLHRNVELTTYEDVEKLLDVDSVLGKVKVEGVVLKPYKHYFGDDGKPVFAKVVSADFRELHASNPEYKTTNKKEAVIQIAEGVSTLPRWRKTVQRCRDAGLLVNDPRDLQYLIKDLQADIMEECEEEIKARLYSAFRKKILGAAVKGFPEWYKNELARSVFDESHDS
jgi:hypothetical protein